MHACYVHGLPSGDLRTHLSQFRRFVCFILMNNGYPEHVVGRAVKNTLDEKADQPVDSNATDQDVTIRLSWLGRVSNGFRRDINADIAKGFFSTHSLGLFSQQTSFFGRAKDVLPTTAKSSVVYQFACCCMQTYVGRISQCLSARIEQHIPRKLLDLRATVIPKDKADSAVTQHLKES